MPLENNNAHTIDMFKQFRAFDCFILEHIEPMRHRGLLIQKTGDSGSLLERTRFPPQKHQCFPKILKPLFPANVLIPFLHYRPPIWASNCTGVTIGIPSTFPSTSKSLSPETKNSARPTTAIKRYLRSPGSRHSSPATEKASSTCSDTISTEAKKRSKSRRDCFNDFCVFG